MPSPIEPLEPRRHLSAGDLDPSFGNGGTITLRNGTVPDYGPSNAQPTAVTVDHAGRTLVLSTVDTDPEGSDRPDTTVLTRLTPDGRPDTRFAIPTGGSIELDLYVRPEHVLVDSQNRIYVSTYGNDGRVYRYTESGKLDRTYGAYVASGDIGDVENVTMGDDDVLWAFTTAVNADDAPASFTASLFRIAPDGRAARAVDLSPLSQPPVTAGKYNIEDTVAYDLRTLPDGSVLAVGTSTTYVDAPDAYTKEIAAVAMKFNANGRPDRTYGTRGRAVFRRVGQLAGDNDFGGIDVTPVGIANDGTVVLRDTPPGDDFVGGTPRNVTLTPAGRYGGVATFIGPEALGDFPGTAFLTQPDGRRLVLDDGTNTLRRYNANGTRDTTFNGGSPFTGVTAIAFGPDNTLLTADTGRSATDSKFVVRRIEL